MRVTVDDVPRIGPIKCYVDDVDVTNSCIEAEDEEGYVIVYQTDDAGKIKQEDGWPLKKMVRGRVRIECASYNTYRG